MKQNKYDEQTFFDQYKNMDRSIKGLEGAGEWHALKNILPSFDCKNVLDLGCGFGWHCRYAIENGAKTVTGVDLSERMLNKAKEINDLPGITYIRSALEDITFQEQEFDCVISSLTFHYIKDFDPLCMHINRWLKPGGNFVFSVEHPIFTARPDQDWIYDAAGNKLYWPVDHYFEEGKRETHFLQNNVIKYHRTLTTYLTILLANNFAIDLVTEPQPNMEMINSVAGMADELRRPMMLIVSAQKRPK
ncbi:class I SAM-dependent methyltransferase [uncultured Sphingobacterium sp.]|jgi:SAM-dependent methyltransferase|uniref:class I SAM-dependent methyltransferase n=1 Tax=uncultured Sphingobacterium sp. TaxID=182688 RepID=UPI003748F756